MQLFGVAIVVLLVGITLLVLWRSAPQSRAARKRGDHELPRAADSTSAERRQLP
jgi:Flp pilus assembly protein TadB